MQKSGTTYAQKKMNLLKGVKAKYPSYFLIKMFQLKTNCMKQGIEYHIDRQLFVPFNFW